MPDEVGRLHEYRLLKGGFASPPVLGTRDSQWESDMLLIASIDSDEENKHLERLRKNHGSD